MGGVGRAWLAAVLFLAVDALHGDDVGALLSSTPHEVVTILGPTPTNDGRKLVDLTLETHGRKLILALTRHDEIFHADYEHIVYGADGTVLERAPLEGHCIYRGHVFAADDAEHSEELGNAMLSVCGGVVEGRFNFDGHELYVAPHPQNALPHVVFHHEHWAKSTGADGWTCGVEDAGDLTPHFTHAHAATPAPSGEEHAQAHAHAAAPALSGEERGGGAAAEIGRRRLGGTPGNTNKYVEMLIVNDYARCSAFTAQGKTLSEMATRSAAIMAVVDSWYYGGYTGSPNFDFNYRFTIISMVSFAHGDPYTATTTNGGTEVDVDSLLAKFQEWRVAATSAGEIPSNDAGHLFSGDNFDGSTVGYAGVQALCRGSMSTGINQAGVSKTDAQTAAIVAHEFGHNVGMRHTNTVSAGSGVPSSCYDTNNPHIMDPSTSSTPATTWTACSKAWMNDFLNNWYGTPNYSPCFCSCVENAPATAWSGAAVECGDGVREGSEQCDCGAVACSIVDPGCDDTTCMLVAGAQCSVLDQCCQTGSGTQSVFKPSGVTCRAATSFCDYTESCTGSSATCPADQSKAVGTSCSTPQASAAGFCYGGSCNAQAEQCHELATGPYNGQIGNGYCGATTGASACSASLACGTTSCYSSFNLGDGVIMPNDGAPCGASSLCMAGTCTAIADLTTPTKAPTTPTKAPTTPTKSPTKSPTLPTRAPTSPTRGPTQPTNAPTSPTFAPTSPTRMPTKTPTVFGQTYEPTEAPTKSPTAPRPGDSAIGEGAGEAGDAAGAGVVVGVVIALVVVLIIVCTLCIGGMVVAMVILLRKHGMKEQQSQSAAGRGTLSNSDSLQGALPGKVVEMSARTPSISGKALGSHRSMLDVLRGKKAVQKKPRHKDSVMSVVGSRRDDDGNALPAGWARHHDEDEDLPYYTKGKRPATWTRPQGAAASAALSAGTADNTGGGSNARMAAGGGSDRSWAQVRKSARRGTWQVGKTVPSKKENWNAYRDSATGLPFWTEGKTGRSTWTPPSGSQYRIADDGFAYNKQEFVDHYGGLHEWNASRPVSTDFTGAQWDGQRAAV